MSYTHSFIFYLSFFYSVQDCGLITTKEPNMNNKFMISGLVTKKTTIQSIITVQKYIENMYLLVVYSTVGT